MASQLLGSADLAELHNIAKTTIDASLVRSGAGITGVGVNSTGHDVRVPGGTQNYYPAFWIRDAAMMLGTDFVSQKETEGWIKVVIAAMSGSTERRLEHSMVIPPYSVPDHVTLKGEGCFYPGAYAEQGVGDYGLLPPADDAFYFVGMVAEQRRLAGNDKFLASPLQNGSEAMSVLAWAEKAFEGVAVDPATGLVVCDPVQTRVDWGFCDSVRKTGSCLMPSLLRWRAAGQLAGLDKKQASTYREIVTRIAASLRSSFLKQVATDEAMLVSATGLGQQDDIWASAFTVSLGVLPKEDSTKIAEHLLRLYKAGKITAEGQVRHLPVGEYWRSATSGKDTYQNGGYWGTPTGWLVRALATVDRAAARQLFGEYMLHLRQMKAKGAPFEWCNPATGQFVNAQYASTVGLVYTALVAK
ncbi:MAG: hypothetical protein JSS65_10275 [Armatimonadetes bacterium]|nr:hypothetical protein [Armatimonadota bacterium]